MAVKKYIMSTNEKAIGDIIRQSNNLTADQVEKVLAFQRQNGCKFGEAAVELGFVKRSDVLWALSQQFNYPYSSDTGSSVSSELVVAHNPFADEAEYFRDIRSQLIAGAMAPDQPRRAMAVISPNVGDGKSFLSANLAVAFSQLGARTLLVDADLRSPRQQEVFNVTGDTGLSSVLSGRTEVNVIKPIAELPSLFVLPVGVTPPNPLELVQGAAFSHLLADLLNKFEYVIVDTPAASHGADCRVIAAKCGAALVVGRKAHTKAQDLRSLSDMLKRSKVSVTGIVLNNH